MVRHGICILRQQGGNLHDAKIDESLQQALIVKINRPERAFRNDFWQYEISLMWEN